MHVKLQLVLCSDDGREEAALKISHAAGAATGSRCTR